MPLRRRRLSQRATLALAAAVAALGIGASNAAALAPSSSPTGDWMVVGGRVDAVARAGNAMYLGGKFQGLARHAPGLAAFDPDSGDFSGPTAALDPLSGTSITVRATVAAPDGGIYVAGDFAGAGGVAQPRLLRFTAAGALDAAFKPQVAAGAVITNMDVGAGVLYLAGSFTTIGGSARSGGVAAVDAATGAVKAWQPAVPSGSVSQIVAGSDAIYLAGSFAQVAAVARSNVAAVSPVDGKPTSWNPNPDGAVHALAVSGSTVYLGGTFTKVGGAARAGVAAVATGTGTLKTSWAPPAPNADVQHIVADATHVFVSGTFNLLGAQRRNGLASLNPTTGAVASWDPAASRPPSDLALSGDHVYLSWAGGADYPQLGSAVRCQLASVSADTAAPTAWNPGIDKGETGLSCSTEPGAGLPNSGATTLSVAGGKVWAGGNFTVANVRPRSGLAALDATTGEPLAWAPRLGNAGPNGTDVVQDLAPSADGSTIYVGGSFTKVNDQTRPNAAAITSAGAGTLTDWNPAPASVVRALALSPDGKEVYLGGDFMHVGAADRPRLVAVGAATTGATTVSDWRPAPDSPVLDLTSSDPAGGRLYAAGAFTAIGGAPRSGLAAFDVGSTPAAPALATWSPALTGTPHADVEVVALNGANVVAGGRFSTADGAHANLAAFAVADGAPTAWKPVANGTVQTVAVDADGSAYVSGTFSAVGAGEARAGAAAFAPDGTPTGWDPSPGASFPASDADGLIPPGGAVLLPDLAGAQPGAGRVVLTGAFTTIGGQLQAGVAFFGAAAQPTAGGPPSISGNPQVGERLTCNPASWGGGRGTRTVSWLRGGELVPGQTASTFTLTAAESGKAIICRETMTNAAAAVSQDSAPVTVVQLPPALSTPPSVAGDAWTGGNAQCTTGLWTNAPTTYSYAWFLDAATTPIVGADMTTGTYLVPAEDQDHKLACEVTATNSVGSKTARSEQVTVTEAPPAPSGPPQIVGDPRVGTKLTCALGPWERADGFAYQWLRDRVPLVDAVDTTYVPTSRDLGASLTCLVTAGNPGGTTDAESDPVVVLASVRSTGTGRRANVDDANASAGTSKTAAKHAVDIRSVHLRSSTTLTVVVSAPAAGTVTLVVVRGTATKASAATVRAAKATKKPAATKKTAKKKKAKPAKKPKPVSLAFGSRKVTHSGSTTFQLKLFTRARQLLTSAGKIGLPISVRATFRPAKGTAASSDRAAATLFAPGLRR
jgi:hypothetical protein